MLRPAPYALAASILALPAAAQTPVTPDGLRGYVGADWGKTWIEDSAGKADAESLGLEAAVAIPLKGRLGAQVDVKGARYDFAGGHRTVASPTLHLYGRNQYGLVGGFAGYSKAGDADAWGAGVEAERFFTGGSLYGSLGYAKISDLSDTRLLSGRAEARVFVTENLRLSGSAGYVDARSAGSSDHGWTAGAGAEYRFANLPFSVTADYQHGKLSRAAIKSDAVRIGVRWMLGNDTLAERDQGGASLANVLDLFGGPIADSVFGASAP